MPPAGKALVWFRQDLRLEDNPALFHACRESGFVVPLYILDDENAGSWKIGGAGRWWLFHSLAALNGSLNGNLILRRGDAMDILPRMAREFQAESVYWNRCFEPWRTAQDSEIEASLEKNGIRPRIFNAALLWDTHATRKEDGTPYQIFTPFYNKGCLAKNGEPPRALPPPASLPFDSGLPRETLPLEVLGLMPSINWHAAMGELWTPGEPGAKTRLKSFLDDGLAGYARGRDFPSSPKTSRLSPHLHWGEISPRTVWHEVKARAAAERLESDADSFCRELGWREFSYTLLHHFPFMAERPLQEKFHRFPWKNDPQALTRWQKGQTGYPIVDAGMRELWATGTMHNRVRMIAASFLVKDLLIHWTEGARWFWDTLVDADLANNSASWQWVAGCGMDAAPYFRIFNPVTQSLKFDPDGAYIRKWVPELRALPSKHIHAPWLLDSQVPGYPLPLADHAQARERALAAFSGL